MPLFTDFKADTLIDQQAENPPLAHEFNPHIRPPPLSRGAIYTTPATGVVGVLFHWRVVW